MDIKQSSWITSDQSNDDICPVFRKSFSTGRSVRNGELQITALGVYEAELNGHRIGDFILAPGWTSYDHRLQIQTYDVTDLLAQENELIVTIGRGWFRSPMPGFTNSEDKSRRFHQPCGLIASLTITYQDGTQECICTDGGWQCGEGPVRFSEIYDGEHYDARIVPHNWKPAEPIAWSKDILIPQEGETVREIERVMAASVFTTPAGETIVDFGQEITGYVEFNVDAKAGDCVQFVHGEVLDSYGNFYNSNYRSAKTEVQYICRDGQQCWHPRLTFFGFRYIKLLQWPGTAKPENFVGIVLHSDMRRTGWLESGDVALNQLFSNIVWGQRCNFLDVPTDCPQRDERLGWTGDAQVFVKAASYFYDVDRFFIKWLHDLKADQRADGEVGQVIPDLLPESPGSAAWGDAAVICPWQIYQTYHDIQVLRDQFSSMRGWVNYITGATSTPYLWTDHFHFGDWLGLDAPSGSYKGSSREEFIATAFYAHSTELLIKAGHILGEDMTRYEDLYQHILSAFRSAYPTYLTQTEHVLAVQFQLAEDLQRTADALAEMVRRDGVQLRTGFVGTPYLLHVLSSYGHADLAWDLLLRPQYPGWLYPITRGATTIWEHWDGIHEDGSFWSDDMNSYNHYAYGSVADWVFEQAAGIRHTEDHPGFTSIIYAPHPDRRIGWLRAELHTRNGQIRTKWTCGKDGTRYELETPVPALIQIGGKTEQVQPGKYTFWSD